MEMLIGIIIITIFVCIVGGHLWSVSWAIGDARKRGHDGGFIIVLFWLFGPLAALVWLGSRPSETLIEREPETYNNADDALAAANRLDQLGDWDTAVALYDSIASRWPEHSEYVANCVTDVKEKLAQLPKSDHVG